MKRDTRIRATARPLALVTLLAFAGGAFATSTQEGEVKFNNHCRTCHSTKEGDNRMGPSLHDIFGAKAGAASGYGNYSHGLKSSGIVWDEKTLDHFIANPDTVVPNNNMKPYKGVTDPAVREQIVTFLKSRSEEGAASESR